MSDRRELCLPQVRVPRQTHQEVEDGKWAVASDPVQLVQQTSFRMILCGLRGHTGTVHYF